MRRRLEFLADQVSWLVGDVACLALMAVFLPLVPVFKAFDRGRHAGEGGFARRHHVVAEYPGRSVVLWGEVVFTEKADTPLLTCKNVDFMGRP